MSDSKSTKNLQRRDFIKQTALATTGVAVGGAATTDVASAQVAASPSVHRFAVPVSLVHPQGWEKMNPGYWKIEDGALRRRLVNVGDRARRTGFPFH